MKELRRHQSGWVITFLVAVRNDWQSKLVLPREGGRESRATEKCTRSVLSFHETASLTVKPRILFRSFACFSAPSFFTLSARSFPYHLFSQAILFPSSTSLSLFLFRDTSIFLPFSQNEARRAENRALLYTYC